MSLVDLIVGQKVILISIGVALLLIFAAIVLAILPRIRRSRALKAQQRAEKARLAAEKEAEAMVEQVRAAPAKGKAGAPAPATAAPAAVAQAAPAAAAKPAPAPAAPPAAAKPAAPLVSTEPAKQPEATSGGNDAMKDLLSSFADEGNSERVEALLRGMSDVEMAHLLTLAQNVKVQMSGGKTVTVVTSKELQ